MSIGSDESTEKGCKIGLGTREGSGSFQEEGRLEASLAGQVEGGTKEDGRTQVRSSENTVRLGTQQCLEARLRLQVGTRKGKRRRDNCNKKTKDGC